MIADEDTEREKWLSRLPIAAAVAVLGIAFYVLSPGPIVLLIEHGRASDQRWAEVMERTVVIVYRPLQLAYDEYPSVADFYDGYFKWLGIR